MRIFENVEFSDNPIMFAAWPGMGNVGIIAMDYMRTQLKAKVFAEIDMSPFFIPDSIIVKDGIAQFPDIPSAVFYYTRNPNIIIFESNAQIIGRDGITIIKTIINIAEQFKVKKIFTAAAYALPMTHNQPSHIFAAASKKSVFENLVAQGVKPMPDGYIAGLNGLLLGVAALNNIDSCCLLGTIPSFASNLSYPKASLEIIKVFGHIIDTEIDYTKLEENIEIVDSQLATIEDRIKEYFPVAMERDGEEDNDMPEMEDEEVPRYIMDKIERLFDEVDHDKSKATILKNELDRWNLYELYEYRFLRIFKNKEK